MITIFKSIRRKIKGRQTPLAPVRAEPQNHPTAANVRDTILASNACGGTNQDLPPQTAFREIPETPAPAENEPVRNNRDQRLRIRFTQNEMNQVKQRTKEAGTDCSKYVRSALSDTEVIHTPQPACKALSTMLNRPGRRLNDFLARANTTGFIDILELEKTLSELWACYRELAVYYGGEDEVEKTKI